MRHFQVILAGVCKVRVQVRVTWEWNSSLLPVLASGVPLVPTAGEPGS